MKRVLLVINNDTFSRQINRWAIVIKKQRSWEPIIFITKESMGKHLDDSRNEGIQIISPISITSAVDTEAKPQSINQSGMFKRIGSGLRKNSTLYGTFNFIYTNIYKIFQILKNILIFSKRIRFIENVICKHEINALIIAESSPAYEAPFFIHAAHQCNIPVITVPMEKWNPIDFAECYLTDKTLSQDHLLNKFIGILYPHWIMKYKGQKILRVQPELLLPLEFLGLRSPNPWQMIGNNEDAIAVDSESTNNYYLNLGFSPSKMHIIGAGEHDLLFQSSQNRQKIKNTICSSLNLPPNRPIILSGLLQKHYLSGRPECDFQQYEDLVRFYVQSLAANDGYNIIISLHPSHNLETLKYIEQWGVKISQQDLTTLIPICDFYVAFSSTIPWAIACGKPVVAYNAYRFPDTLYTDVQGVMLIDEQQEFIDTLQRLTNNRAYYDEIVQEQARVAEHWGKIDGKAGKRLSDLLDLTVDTFYNTKSAV
jgi:hypothetical protein